MTRPASPTEQADRRYDLRKHERRPSDDLLLVAEGRAAARFHKSTMPYTADIINRMAARIEELLLERNETNHELVSDNAQFGVGA